MILPAAAPRYVLRHRHLFGIEGLSVSDIVSLLDLADEAAEFNRQIAKKGDILAAARKSTCFSRPLPTQSSFELAGKRLGADVMNMAVAASSVKKGETLLDTAQTLNAMRPDILVVRHHCAGAVELSGPEG